MLKSNSLTTFGVQGVTNQRHTKMKKYDKKILELEIAKGTPCDLKHGDKEFHHAVEFLTQEIGYKGKKMYSVTIAVCDDCANSLASPEWILLYCLKCTSNQWLYKPLGRLDYYKKHICWMSCCPECCDAGEKANIFFTD